MHLNQLCEEKKNHKNTWESSFDTEWLKKLTLNLKLYEENLITKRITYVNYSWFSKSIYENVCQWVIKTNKWSSNLLAWKWQSILIYLVRSWKIGLDLEAICKNAWLSQVRLIVSILKKHNSWRICLTLDLAKYVLIHIYTILKQSQQICRFKFWRSKW